MRRLILRCDFSPGDIVMMTAAVRDLHRCYPGEFETDVRTRCPELWENNPYLTRLHEREPGVEVLECTYPLIDTSNEAPHHCLHGFIDFLNTRLELGIKLTEWRGDIHISALEKSWYSQVYEVVKREVPFWIVAAGGKHDISIKWWSTGRFQEVVDAFRGRVQFVQVGDYEHHHPRLDGVIDLRGQTSLRELVRLVYHAQGVLCPVTSLMHLAAAVETAGGGLRPCVVVAGGREPPHWETYPGHQFVHTIGALECCALGGCWRDRVRPLGDGDERDEPDRLCVDVSGDLPRCMDLIRAADVVRRIEYFFEGGAIRYLDEEQRSTGLRGVAATATNDYDEQPLTLGEARLALEEYLRVLPACPEGLAGRGIVICGGGPRYLPGVWVTVNILRQLGCQLPIEVWHLGPREMDADMRERLHGKGARCVDAGRVRKHAPVRRLSGWGLKAYALVHCPFAEVLLLDADNVPVLDPEYLFATREYGETGAIFWPDYGRFERTHMIWRSCGLEQPPGPEFESGQIMTDKRRCWRALRLALWFNEHSDFYYRYLHGDKETFHLAFQKLGQPFSMPATPIHPLKGTMCQHDFEGRRIFQHRNGDKWKLSPENQVVEDFWLEEDCRRYLRELRDAVGCEAAGGLWTVHGEREGGCATESPSTENG